MDFPKVSIIVPVYNKDKTIKKCFDSIIAQTLREWEVIIVDDGSTDISSKICDIYAKQDSRFNVIHQNNSGVSSARQNGLDNATGDYIIHVDPDDWIEPTMLEELYNKAVSDGSDMVICDFYKDFGDRTTISQQRPTSLKSNIVLNDMFISIHGSCCNKLVKKSCIDRCQAKFPDGINYCEDVCFNVQLLKHDIKISYINKALYHYVQYSTSITNNYTVETLHSQERFVSFISNQLSEDSFPVTRSKEIVKKLAYRNAVLSNKDFAQLYPEIVSTHDDNIIMKWMYKLAFTNHFLIAGLIRKAYNFIFTRT